MRDTKNPEVLARLLVSLGVVTDESTGWSSEDGPDGPCVLIDVGDPYSLLSMSRRIHSAMEVEGYDTDPVTGWVIEGYFNPKTARAGVRITRRREVVPGPAVFDLGTYEVRQVGGYGPPMLRLNPLDARGDVFIRLTRDEARPIGRHLYRAVRLKLEVLPEAEGELPAEGLPGQPAEYLSDAPEPTLDPNAPPGPPYAYATAKAGVPVPPGFGPEVDPADIPPGATITPITEPQDDPVPF